MIQRGSFLTVSDNSGAKIAYCIHNISKPKSRYAYIGDIVLISVKKLRAKRRFASKIKKGTMAHGLIIRSKNLSTFFTGDKIKFYELSIILFYRKTFKLIGTRIFGFLPFSFRYSQFVKLLSICTGCSM